MTDIIDMTGVVGNPLFEDSALPYGAPAFDRIREEHFVPAFEAAIAAAKKEVDSIADNGAEPDFENTIAALDRCGKALDRVAGVFYCLNSACTSPGIREIAEKITPMMTGYSLYIFLNGRLLSKVKHVYDRKEALSLSDEEAMLLEKTYKAFVRNGAGLDEDGKKLFSRLSEELSLARLAFEKNLLDATNDYVLHVTDESGLGGLPDYVKEAAAEEARTKNMSGWVFTLARASMGPFLKFSTDRDARRRIWTAFNTRAYGGKYDNCRVINRIVSLKNEIAHLLGYGSYADYVLEERMAKNRENVNGFLGDLVEKTLPFARRDVSEVAEYARSCGFSEKMMPWDFSFWSEKYRESRFSLKEEELKPYFELDGVVKAAFSLAGRLYGLTFEELPDFPVYHEDVRVYDVKDADGTHLSLIYMDFFPRENKNAGAWMDAFYGQYVIGGKDHRPCISIVTNFTKPTSSMPSLLTHDEVTTLLHELGHALHETFSKCTYSSVSGTNVPWDFVEFPSQIMENWAFEPEFLNTFARHYVTGDMIPEELVKRLIDSKNYLAGYAQLRQLQFGVLDMAWYSSDRSDVMDVEAFEREVLGSISVLPVIDGTAFSPSFSHIFDGGYSAGYYSYKWAEVLEADAFSLFEEKGVFNREVASSLRRNILSKGGTEDAAEMYRRFRGRDPESDALMKKQGLVAGK
ncbi:MAG: M3 family metallopeptidase [Muribaculum sp.]|uniref:M3 family metallopeptidase n=1 Tax=Candidatus Merdivivens faecigallinarum TaxID=2840871 RepID=A0A9D9J0V5_9BACT|nr:M3 family metallopeptidase [Candidatus Merdivivens faecigallinarum]